MSFKTLFAAAAATALLGLASAASATVVFSDGFEGDTPGAPVGSLTNFDITGTVDVVAASNPYGIAATSNVVDLDGSPGPGSITSKSSFTFNSGDLVTLTFVVGGAQRGSISDPFTVGIKFAGATSVADVLGTGVIPVFSAGPFSFTGLNVTRPGLPGSTPFTTSALAFRALSGGSFKFSFGTTSNDNIGPLLDSVSLDITGAGVPEPASWALMIGGFGLAGAALRRRRAITA